MHQTMPRRTTAWAYSHSSHSPLRMGRFAGCAAHNCCQRHRQATPADSSFRYPSPTPPFFFVFLRSASNLSVDYRGCGVLLTTKHVTDKKKKKKREQPTRPPKVEQLALSTHLRWNFELDDLLCREKLVLHT